MEYRIDANGSDVVVHINGNITFSQNVRFRQMLKEVTESNAKTCTFNISGVEMVDSAGLGMFLIAKEQSDTDGWKLSVTGASGHVETMLKLTKLSELIG